MKRNSYIWCSLLSFCLMVFLLLSVFIIPVNATSFTMYSSVNQNDTIVNNLIGLYLNSPGYDPYNEYFLIRTGQYEYYLFYGKSITNKYQYYRYYGIQNGYNTVYGYDTGEGTDLSVTSNGYVGVGNVQGSIVSDKASEFGFGYVITVLVILIAILTLFKTFKKVYRTRSDRGYTL